VSLEKVEKIPWHWIIPLIIFLAFSNVSIQFVTPGAETLDIGKLGYLHYYSGIPVLIYLFILLFIRAKGVTPKISKSTLAYIYTVASIAMGWCGYSMFHQFGRLLGARYKDSYGLAKHIPYFWAPSREALVPFMTTGGPISPEWIPVIIYWSIFMITVWFCLTGFSIFLRYQWIEVEQLPYPYVQTAIEFIGALEEPKGSKVKLILVSALVGFIFFLLYFLRGNFPWLPDIYGWYNPNTHNVAYYGTLRPQTVFPSLYQSVVGLTQITYNPFYIALALLVPLDTLFSASFFYIVYILIGTQIAYIMGYYTGIETASDGTRADMLRHIPPINITGFVEHGVLPTILIMAILLNYKSVIVRPLKLALGKGSSDELEKKEPTSYRTALIIIVASSIALLTMLLISGFDFVDGLIYVVVSIIIYQLSYARVRGFAGPIPVGDRVAPWFFRWHYPNVKMPDVPRSFFLYGISGHYLTDTNSMLGHTALPILENWRIASNLNVDNRNMFKVMCATVLIAPFIGFTTFVVVGHYIGIARSTRIGMFWDSSSYGTPSYVYTRPSPPPIWPWVVSGALLTVVLAYMHFKFAWWPLEPVGLFIGCGGPGVKIGLAWVFIIAYIIKYITIKIGGAKAYSETMVPIVIGFVAGTVLATLIGGIIGMIRFLIPM